jgi:hypothetical protein
MIILEVYSKQDDKGIADRDQHAPLSPVTLQTNGICLVACLN